LIAIPYIPKPQGSTKDIGQIKHDLLGGLSYIWQSNALRTAMGFAILAPIGSGLLNSLLVVFALHVLKTDEAGYGMIEAGFAIGIIVSGLFIGQIGNRLKRGLMMAYGWTGMGVGAILLTFSPSLGIAMLATTFSGLMNGIALVGIRTLLQENTQSEYRGRVSGAWNTAIATGGIVGMSLAGLADIFPVQAMLIVAGLVNIVAGVALARLSTLRNV
jgi:DHA3 family macrolide efflux protein-like MFS transporter